MKCIYCKDDMVFDGGNEVFICKTCRAKLSLFQHPDMTNIEQLTKIEFGKIKRPVGSENCNNDGIATQWYRGDI